jgi:hypothetical protein
MPPVPGPARAAPARVDALLRDLGVRLRRASAPEEPLARSPTGLYEVDRALGGGFPRGGLGEIAGPAGSGRTSLALALLATATRAGECAAVVDGSDAFDPPSAEAAGVALERLLWVRTPRGGTEAIRAALRSVERLLEARGFALVLLDLADDWAGPGPGQSSSGTPAACLRRPTRTPLGSASLRAPAGACRRPSLEIPSSAWPRLVRAAAASRTSLVVLGARRLAGTFAAQSVELDPARARFSETPALLEGLDGHLQLVRNRLGPAHRVAAFRLPSCAA